MISSCRISSTLVIVDPAVCDYQHLIDGVSPQADVAVLDSSRDGIEQITEILADYSEIENLHIVSHGEPGALCLNGSRLELDTLERYQDQLRSWTKALAAQANVLLYGCRLAAGDRGKQFVQQLSQVVERAIAASFNLTGSAALGGDWQLGMQTGTIRSPLAFQTSTLATYPHVLAPAVPNQLYGVSQTATGSEIRILDIDNGTSTQAGTLAFTTFAAARDQTTGRVYYIESTGTATARVAYWDPANPTNPGTIVGTTGVAIQFLKLAQAADGTLYGLGADTTDLYTINPTTGAATSLGPIAGFTFGSGDAAFDPDDPNTLYVTSTDGAFLLYRINVTTRTATLVGNTGLIAGEDSGSLAFGPDGRLYATSSNAGAPALYALNTTTAAATLVGNTGNRYNDFATLPTSTSQSSLDVQASITDGRTQIRAGSSITYTITVTNNSTTLDAPVDITSAIPTGITGVSWTGRITGGGSFPTTADQTGTGNSIDTTVNLNAGATVTYTVTGTVPSSLAEGTVLTATVTAEPDDGLVDPTPSNNSATDTTSVTASGGGDNEPPTVTDREFNVRTGSTVRLTGLSGRDSDGTIAYYVVNSVPSSRDGVLYLGNPNNGGTAITGRRRLSTSQIGQLYFQSASTFDGGSFTYLAQDNDGDRSDPGTVTLNPRSSTSNDPPTVTDAEVTVGAGSTTRLRGLSGEDSDGTIDYYVITSIPPSSAGTLYLGNPNSGGTAITGRRRISTSQINQIYFRASTGFESGQVSFNYLAQDDDGARSTPGTVTLEVGVSAEPGGECDPGEPINGNNRNNRLEGDQLQDGETTRTGKADTIDGRGGNDVIDGLRCDDTLSGGAGNDVMSGDPGEDRLNGDSGNDTLRGGTGTDTLDGGAGNDGLSGITANDRIFGRQGQDRIYGGGGNDVVKGGDGNDVASGDAGNDRLIGDAGNDTLRGGTGTDTLEGGAGNDGLSGISGNDRIFGRQGRDRMFGGGGNDVAKGGDGDDFASGNIGRDRLIGDAGNDTLRGGAGGDILDGRTDNDGISGLSDNDRIFGRQGRDRLFGGGGNDVIRAGAGSDRLYGSRNNDRLLGESGGDFLKGGSGADTLRGGRGRDTLYGNSQDDFLVGNTGDDTIIGGGGDDSIIGGQGRDQYVFNQADQGVDTIQEFQVGKDKVDVSAILAGNNYSRANAFNRYIRLVEGSSNTVTVRIDANGNTSGGFRTLATLTQVTGTVTANDFIV